MFESLVSKIKEIKLKVETFHERVFRTRTDLTMKEHVYRYIFTWYQTNAKKEIGFKCAALVYYTAFAIVPMLAFIFSVTDGLGFDNVLDKLASYNKYSTPEFFNVAMETARGIKIDATSSLVTVISSLFLLWSVWSLMDRVSQVFKDIWENQIPADKHRTLWKRIVSRLSLLFFSPLVIIVMYAGLTQITFIESYIVRKIDIGFFFKGINHLVMYAATAFVFTMMYKYIPSVKVRFKNALISGFAAAFLFVVFQLFYILVQSKVSKYNLLYGAIAALPLFLLWAYYSWEIIIKGAVLCHTLEYPEEYVKEDVNEDKLTVGKIVKDIVTFGKDTAIEVKDKITGSSDKKRK